MRIVAMVRSYCMLVYFEPITCIRGFLFVIARRLHKRQEAYQCQAECEYLECLPILSVHSCDTSEGK